MSDLPVDLDAEAIFLDGGWYTREDLTRRIKSMLDSGDFNVARPSAALEQLTHTLSSIRTLTVRVTPELAEGLNQLAARSGKSVGAAIREAVQKALGDQGPATAAPAATKAAPAPAPAPTPGRIAITAPSPSSPTPTPARAAPAPVHTFPAPASAASYNSLPSIDVDEEPMVQQEPTVRYAMSPSGTTQDDLPKVIVDEQPMVIAGPGALANAGVPAARPIELTQKKS